MAAFALDTRPHRTLAEINITPLVDVMLVLLIIFMLSAPILTHKLKLDLPAPGPTPPPREHVDIAVKQTGELYWNGVAINRAQLAQQLVGAAQQAEPPIVALHPERATRYQLLADVMAAAQNAQLRNISIEPAH